jgi:hypothetical protein
MNSIWVHAVVKEEVEDVCRAALMHEFVRDLLNGYDTLYILTSAKRGALTLQRYVSVHKCSTKQLTYCHRLACRRPIFALSPAPRHRTPLQARKQYTFFRKTPVYCYGRAKLFHQPFPTSAQCPVPLQAPKRHVFIRKTYARHP